MNKLHTIEGNNGTGKTLLLIYLALKFKLPVYSNFKLNLPNYHSIDWNKLFELPDNILVFIDEAYIMADSRNSFSIMNKLMSYIFAFQKRKRKMNIYLTQPLISSLDVRLRQSAEVRIRTAYRWDDSLDDFYYYIYLQPEPEVYRLLDIKTITYEEAISYFKYYDTYELIPPPEMKEIQFQLEKRNPKLMKTKVLELVKECENEINKITYPEIQNWLFNKEYPLGYKTYLYFALKNKEGVCISEND